MFFPTVGNLRSHFSCSPQHTEVFKPARCRVRPSLSDSTASDLPGKVPLRPAEQEPTVHHRAEFEGAMNQQLQPFPSLYFLEHFCTGWTGLLGAALAPNTRPAPLRPPDPCRSASNRRTPASRHPIQPPILGGHCVEWKF